MTGVLFTNEKPAPVVGRTPPPEPDLGVAPPVFGPGPKVMLLDVEPVAAPREKELLGWLAPPAPNTKLGVRVGAVPPIPTNAEGTGAAGLAWMSADCLNPRKGNRERNRAVGVCER